MYYATCEYKWSSVLSPSDYEAVVKLSEDFNGADLRNVCTEAGKTLNHAPTCTLRPHPFAPPLPGMFAIRAEREYVENEDFMKAVRKVSDTKKLESKMDYKQIWNTK